MFVDMTSDCNFKLFQSKLRGYKTDSGGGLSQAVCPWGALNILGFEQLGAFEASPFASIFLEHNKFLSLQMGMRKSDTSVGTTIGIKTKRTRLKGVEFPRFDRSKVTIDVHAKSRCDYLLILR
jgi:hypothetical protein